MTLTARNSCFQLKASFSPCTILQFTRYDLDAFASQLASMVQATPSFFQGAPVIIELEKVRQAGVLNFHKIKQLLLSHQMIPVGSRGGSPEQLTAAAEAGLPEVHIGKSGQTRQVETKPVVQAAKTLLIDKPVRSGMQIYAKQSDLIVTGAVSTGAEVMADGHIHVYGPLRGRAMAGAAGNTEARIFCRHLDAELVAVAGYYVMKEEIQAYHQHTGGLLQIYLKNEQIVIEPL